jgi:oligopeptide transport system substrate-binding protein
MLNQKDFTLTFLGWSAGWPYPDNWLADLFTSDSTNNRVGFHNASFDALIKQAANETDDAKRLAKYDEAQKLMLTSAAIAPLYARESIILVKPKVKGLVVTPLDGGLKGDTALNAAYIAVGD